MFLFVFSNTSAHHGVTAYFLVSLSLTSTSDMNVGQMAAGCTKKSRSRRWLS